jgi:NAD(P)-dependent dehydrogenase (short-subunit alcohol dehydrogenase family)
MTVATILHETFALEDQVALITGGTGVLGGAMARGMAAAGARVGIIGRHAERAEQVAAEIEAAGGTACALPADVLDRAQLEAVRDRALAAWGRIDILVNAAGGVVAGATVNEEDAFANMSREGFEQALALNLTGTVLPCQVFGAVMGAQGQGSIINISSMAADRAITRVVGYSAAKAGIDNFTRWLAVELAHKHGEGLRVNAIAPGFFIGEQNRRLLLNQDGSLTARGRAIVERTPMGRFGAPDELVGTAIWLASPGSRFVTGVVIPVDGGFSAFSGV